jgi:hypothetical protein
MKSARSVLAFVTCLMAGSGCSTYTESPIRSSLSELTFEGNQYRSSWLASLFGFKGLEHHEFFSISGLVALNTPGMQMFYLSDRTPATAIGISPLRSFVVQGTFEASKEARNSLDCLKDSYLDIGKLTQACLTRTLRLAELKAEKSALLKATPTSPTVSIDAKITAAETALANEENGLSTAKTHFQGLASQKNLIVASWNTKEKDSSEAKFGDTAGAEMSHAQERSGVAFIAGLRVTAIFFGRDFKDFIDREDSGWVSLLADYNGFLTYTLEAQEVVYLNDLSHERRLFAYLDASLKDASVQNVISHLDRVKLQLDVSDYARLSNMGHTGDAQWTVEPISFFPAGRLEALVKERTSRSSGWQLIQGVVTYPRDIYHKLKEQGSNHPYVEDRDVVHVPISGVTTDLSEATGGGG